MPSRSGRTLRQGLDREAYLAVTKFLEEQPDSAPIPQTRTVYSWIQRSNSSLKRKPKKLLEDSLERVLDVMKDDISGEDPLDAIEGDFGPNRHAERSEDANILNRSITGSWASSGAVTPIANGETAKKRDRQQPDSLAKHSTKKRKAEVNRSPPTHYTLEDVGGVDQIIKDLSDILVLPLKEPDEYARMKISIPRGVLLHGPPGCGKTMITRAFAAELQVPFIEILGPSIVSGMSGESEKLIREHFEEARKLAPAIIFIDEIDVIAPKRESAQGSMEKRIVAQFLVSIDGLAMESNEGKPVIVIAATNRPDTLDPALRRGGRFDTEISMGVPNERIRELIMRAQTRGTPVASDIDFGKLAKMTPGFVGADLKDLVIKAGTWQMSKYRAALEQQAARLEGQNVTDDNGIMEIDNQPKAQPSETVLSIRRLIKRAGRADLPRPAGFEHTQISMEAFLSVLPAIQPSSKREGFATVPDTTWEDIGALQSVRKKLQISIVEAVQHPERYKALGITAPTGVLLWGPPGCGKSLLAKAVANESKANFISVKGPELLNKFVGESERSVRLLFTRARSSVPCVIFFDELDALVPRRDDTLSEASSRVVNTLLTELDGLSQREGIYIIAATNRPDIIDTAMIRPGRLETSLYVGLPGPEERVEILRSLSRNIGAIKGDRVQLEDIGRECDGFSGADLGSLVRQAGYAALERGSSEIEQADFESAKQAVRPSVVDLAKYEKMRTKFRC